MRFAGPWGAISQLEAERQAKNPHITSAGVRVFFAAVARANRIGHAEFGPGELADWLGSFDRSGVWTPAHKSTVSKAIAQAKSLELVAKDSSARCLVLSSHVFQKAGRGSFGCKHHGL
ncbi:hypothetical protein C3Y87_10060 [Carbonactinospora thermoautotrophica]|nr:hypothetical protein [Carbonactinospora thermoautotrophica]